MHIFTEAPITCTIDCEQRSNFYVAVLLVFLVATGLNA